MKPEVADLWLLPTSPPLHPGAAARVVTDGLSDPCVSALWWGMLRQVLIQRMQMRRENHEPCSHGVLSPQGNR